MLVATTWVVLTRTMARLGKVPCPAADWRFDMVKTFMDRYLAGELEPDAIDDFVEEWHTGKYTTSLAEFLGMSDDEYWRWVKDANVLPDIRAEREVKA
jgi:hypothetical protein